MRIAQQHAHLVDGADDVEAQDQFWVGGSPGSAVGGQSGAGRGVGEGCEGVFGEDVYGGAVAVEEGGLVGWGVAWGWMGGGGQKGRMKGWRGGEEGKRGRGKG